MTNPLGGLLLWTAGVLLLPWGADRMVPGSMDAAWQWAADAAGLLVPLGVAVLLLVNRHEALCAMFGRLVRSASSSPWQGGSGNASFPTITVGMVTVGAMTFFAVPDAGAHRFACLPLDDLGWSTLVLVTVAEVFLHTDGGHLAVNMVLLALFGLRLEPRLGQGRILATVILGSVLSSLISLNLVLCAEGSPDAASQLIRHPPGGASGAVMALMGLAVPLDVRCPWSTRTPDGSRSRYILQSSGRLLLIGIFLLRDFSSRATIVAGLAGTVDYWAHVGAFLGGLAVAAVVLAEDSAAY